MKRKVLAIALCIVVVLLLFFACDEWRKTTLLEDVDSTMISKVTLCNFGITTTEPEYIKKVVDILQSMKLKKTIPVDRDGSFDVDIYYQNGDVSRFVLRTDCVTVEGKTYKCDRDYCEDLRKIGKELSKESKN